MSTERSSDSTLTATTIKRRYRRAMRAVRQVYLEAEELLTKLAVPSPEACEQMIAGTRPVSLDALLVAVLRQNGFYLSEAWNMAEYDLRDSRCSLLERFHRGGNPLEDERLAHSLRSAVADHKPAKPTAG